MDYTRPIMTFKKTILLRCLATISLLWSATHTLPAHANTATPPKADTAMTCEQIANEVVELDRTIRNARTTQTSSHNTGTGVSVARTVGSFLVGSLGGVIGIVAVGALAGEVVDNSGEKAATIEENAEERQNRLAGIFEGKGCDGELALTEDNPEDVTAIEPASGSIAHNTAPRKPHYNE